MPDFPNEEVMKVVALPLTALFYRPGEKEAEVAGNRQGVRCSGERVHREIPPCAEGTREEPIGSGILF
jgi:hypothetical protein